MQDLSDPESFISQAFRRVVPPVSSFDPEGDWTHAYHDISSYGLKHLQGELTLQRKAGHQLRIEGFRNCPDRYRYYTIAELQCENDPLGTPVAWKVESKVAKTASGAPYLDSGLVKQASVKGGVLTIRTGGAIRTVSLPGNYTCKWCLLDAVGRMAKKGVKEITFTLLDEYDEPCPDQVITLRGKGTAKTRSGTIDVMSYQHTGTATLPGVYYVDGAGRVLFYLGDMQLLALASADGKETGFLK